jgi:uncharacterized protein YaaQ
MKLIAAIVQDQDAEKVLGALMENGKDRRGQRDQERSNLKEI